jgi:hypothetical protein
MDAPEPYRGEFKPLVNRTGLRDSEELSGRAVCQKDLGIVSGGDILIP